ncbi:hypothetical protein JJV70_09310 [Streptomyces sp. JJ66]|uniref:hypothetical protein n=1 Tax=Streptomyces sp. JJ66 TaxID=2803843 RepID=UPI001C59EC1B|nr:hypothetical protein [Streptomyces sp. JJ66]MBW1602304.1 hypothetical protein [Streptomyces sp. JJ66]
MSTSSASMPSVVFRMLSDLEAESAYAWWAAQGKPEPQRFGLTVTAEGQTAWLDDPAASWPV